MLVDFGFWVWCVVCGFGYVILLLCDCVFGFCVGGSGYGWIRGERGWGVIWWCICFMGEWIWMCCVRWCVVSCVNFWISVWEVRWGIGCGDIVFKFCLVWFNFVFDCLSFWCMRLFGVFREVSRWEWWGGERVGWCGLSCIVWSWYGIMIVLW